MSAKSEKILRDFTQALTKPKGTTPYDTTAKVLRVENGIAWVHIAGGVDETPVKMTIDAKAGDTVQVRVSGGRAFLVGNATAPPTDDAEALIAKVKAEVADKKAKSADKKATEAKEIAVNAQQEVEEVSQYFWYKNGTGSEAGAHITEVPQETFESSPAGGNLLMKSAGIYIRQALNKLAEFTNSGLAFFARNGQKVFEIACDNATSTDNVYCYSASRLLPAHDTLTIRYQRLKTAESGTSLMLIYSLGGAITTKSFTKGTAETKTDSDVGLTIAYDGDYTFIATSTSSNEFVFQACEFSKTWYGTEETLHGNATIDGDADIYNALRVGGPVDFYSAPRFGVPDKTFIVEDYKYSYSNISSGGNMNWSETKTKNGYYPIGVVGFNANRATLVVDRAYISNVTVGSCTINLHARAVASASANDAHLYVLWVQMAY